MKKEIYKDNNMENNKQAENKEDNLNQFDLDVYAGTGTVNGTKWGCLSL